MTASGPRFGYPYEHNYSEINGRKINSNALQNSGSEKTNSVCSKEIIFVISRNYYCYVKLTVRGDFELQFEQCGVFYVLIAAY